MVDTKENLKGKIDDAAWTQERRDKAGAAAKGCEAPTSGGIVEAVKEQAHAVAAGAADLAGRAKDTAQEWASSVGDAAVRAKDKVRHMASAAGEKVGEAGQDLTALIRRYPFQALLAGFGVGFLVAHFLRRS
jgi:hypothetical protein